ncbi:hypothetical protein ACE939_04770 [Aquimarina sp. W85]|uniref:hypothetical protein n=1 Tax=Aquimarina rhodophyticola TaxID=3342246 RepID=UPI00366D33CA
MKKLQKLMNLKFIKLIEVRLKNLVHANLSSINEETVFKRIFASLVVILAGLILFSDKITTFDLENTYGFADEQTLIWVVCQTLSPMLLCAAAMMNPYKITYFATIYVYFIQMYWIFNPEAYQLDDALLHVYALGFCVVVLVFTVFTIRLLNLINNENRLLINNIKKLTRHIAVTIKGKYIKEEDTKDYTIETVKIIDSMD